MTKQILLLATVVSSLLTGAAHAATLDIFLGATPGSVSYSVSAAPVVQNIDIANPGPNSLVRDNNSILLPQGFENDNYAKPPLGTTGEYLAVTSNFSSPHTGSATLTLASGDLFGFTWGTIDTYNTLTITDSRHDAFVITGGDISNNPAISASMLAALYPGGFAEGASQTQVEIKDSFGHIVSAQFQSSTNSFEVGGFSTGEAPLPPALVLFGTGLLGLAGFAYQRRQSAKS